MIWRRPLHVRKLLDGCLREPREPYERNQQFLGIKQQPKAVLRDVRDFSHRSGASRHLNLLEMRLDDGLRLAQLPLRKPSVGRERHHGRQPELGLSVSVFYVDVDTRFFAREKEQAELSVTYNCGSHLRTVPKHALTTGVLHERRTTRAAGCLPAQSRGYAPRQRDSSTTHRGSGPGRKAPAACKATRASASACSSRLTVEPTCL